jgi:DNA repair exonuclease SbcCD ATPase subunit
VFNSKKKQAAEAQRAEAEALRARLDQITEQNAELERRLATLIQANAELDHRLGTTGARLVGLEEGVDTVLDERTEELRKQIAALTEQTAVIDSRVTNVSTELTNQLVELSRDIETLNERDRGADSSADDAAGQAFDPAELEARIAERVDVAIDDVLDATERLAAEQARYEIRFRADLAELADRLRRPSAR